MSQRAKILNPLIIEFSEFAIDPTGLFLLESAHATQFIQKGVQAELRLLGVESFRITPDGAFQPEQEFSNDIADASGTYAQFVDETIRLVGKGGGEGLRFQVAFD